MRFPKADPTWTIARTGFDLSANRHYEGVFTLGSGYMSVRGSLEEGLSDDPQNLEYNRLPGDVTLERNGLGKSTRGTFVPGVVGLHPLLNEEINRPQRAHQKASTWPMPAATGWPSYRGSPACATPCRVRS